MSFKKSKQERKQYYLKYVYGWKLRPCSACSGSGHYDHNGSPLCGACGGTGREKYPGPVSFIGRRKMLLSLMQDHSLDAQAIANIAGCSQEKVDKYLELDVEFDEQEAKRLANRFKMSLDIFVNPNNL